MDALKQTTAAAFDFDSASEEASVEEGRNRALKRGRRAAIVIRLSGR